MSKGIKRFIGSKRFYKLAFAIIIPIICQQLFVSIAGYIDSLMINSFSAASYSGVSAANKLMFVFTFVFIGLGAAAGIFISQFFGAGNKEKMVASFNLSWIIAAIFGVVSFFIIHFFGNSVVDLYIQGEAARNYGYRYLEVMKYGMVILAVNMSISSSFRSAKETVLPMIAGIIEIVVNICFNYVLIFGHLGFEAMDAKGAAIATVISRTVSLVILILFAQFWKKSPFKGFLRFPKIGNNLLKAFIRRGTPLVLNELLWAIGNVLFAMFYAYKNDVWYNAYAYAQNVSDLFFIFFAGLGNGTAVIVGAALGAGDFDRARKDADRLKGLAIAMGVTMGVLMAVLAPLAMRMFAPDPETDRIAIAVLRITAIFVTLYAYNSTCFFILRAGGDSVRAFILDQGPTYLVSLPISIVLGVNAAAWGLTLPILYAISHIADVVKFFMSNAFLKSEHWVVNLAEKASDDVIEELEKE